MPHPADVLKLQKNWKLDTPLWRPGVEHDDDNRKGGAMAVKQPELATFDKDCFTATPDGKGVVMTVHHGDPTTEHSDNPRSELREVRSDGDWKGSKGTHTLIVEGQVNRLTAQTQKVVLAQVHGKHKDITVFLLQGDTLCIKDDDDVAFTTSHDDH